MPRISNSDPNLDTNALLGALEPVLDEHGLEAVEVSFQRERPGWVLRVTIEDPKATTPGAGVTLDVCAEVSRGFSAALDATDLIAHAYHLEVGTPGVERPLFDAGDYARFVGQPCKVVLSTALPDGQKALRGTIVSVSQATASQATAGQGEASQGEAGQGNGEAEVTFRVEGGKTVKVAASDIKSGHLVFEPPRGEKHEKREGAKAKGGPKTKASKSNEGGE